MTYGIILQVPDYDRIQWEFDLSHNLGTELFDLTVVDIWMFQSEGFQL